MKYLVAILVLTVLVSAYFYLYRQNKKTPVPAGCENLKPDCAACGIKSCSVRLTQEDNQA